jgi:hypothetical protein
MRKQLRKIYFIFLTPAVLGFTVVCLVYTLYHPCHFSEQKIAVIAPIVFILAAVFALAGPIYYRSLFAHHRQHLLSVSRMELFRFERNLTGIALVAPYLALAAYFLQLPRFYLGGTILMALYAVYYYYPSGKRIVFEQKVFRAGDGNPADSMY